MLLSSEFRQIQCNCGLIYAIPEKWAQQKERDHTTFYCPNCKVKQYYPQLSDKEILKRQLKTVQECCVDYEQKSEKLERSNIALKGHLTRKKQIISAQ